MQNLSVKELPRMKRSDYTKVKWAPYGTGPIIKPPCGSPVIADPTALTPEESPDGKWHLFAHSIWGIHHFISEDGIDWGKGKLLFRNAMRPNIVRDQGFYFLLYEKYRPFQIMFPWLKAWKWRSRIMMRASKDLKKWSGADTIITPTLPWHRDIRYGASVSNPCLVKSGPSYLLFYSASLVYIKDCGFCEPRYIGLAEAKKITGPYRLLEEPIISPDPSHDWYNLGAGALKVHAVEDGFVGFQNGIYIDRDTRKSASAILLLNSHDGKRWVPARQEPIVRPTTGWQRSHVYACDVKYHLPQERFHLYYNARDDWHWSKGKENIGLVMGEKNK